MNALESALFQHKLNNIVALAAMANGIEDQDGHDMYNTLIDRLPKAEDRQGATSTPEQLKQTAFALAEEQEYLNHKQYYYMLASFLLYWKYEEAYEREMEANPAFALLEKYFSGQKRQM